MLRFEHATCRFGRLYERISRKKWTQGPFISKLGRLCYSSGIKCEKYIEPIPGFEPATPDSELFCATHGPYKLEQNASMSKLDQFAVSYVILRTKSQCNSRSVY